MTDAGARLLRVTQARVTRSAAALTLALGVSSTGLVALAVPAHAISPAPVLDSPAAVTSSSTSPSVSFHAAGGSGAPLECATTPAGSPPASWAPCSEPSATFTVTGADGHYDLMVREISATDDGAAAVVDYTLDRVSALDVLPPASPGDDTTPTWTLSGEPGSTFTCDFDGAGPQPCSGSFTPAAPLSAERSYDLVVVAEDVAGNVSPASTTTYVLDTTAPGSTTVSGPTGTANTTTLSWSWPNGSGDDALCTLTRPGGPDPEGACTSGTGFTATVSGDGDYSLSVVLRDAAGNRSAAATSPTYTLDTTAPAAPSFLSGPTGTGTLTSATWTFTHPGTSTTCVLKNGTTTVATTACDSGSSTQSLSSDGSWTLTVSTDDGYGNVASTTSEAYVRDRTGPTPVVSGPTGLSNDATPHVTWTGEMPSTASCRWQRTVGVTVTYGSWTGCDAAFFDPTLPGDGAYRFEAQLTDALGNVGPVTGTTADYVYDGTPPAAPALSTPTTPGNDTTPTVSWPLTDAAECVVASGTVLPATPAWGACSTATSWTPTLAADGSWTLGVRLTDAAGNPGPAAAFTYVLDSAGPTPVVFTSGPSSPGKSPKPTWNLASDADATLTCRVLSGATVVETPTCGSSVQADLSAQPDGSYVIEVTATDPAGNTAVTTHTYVLDTTKPLTPTVTGPASPGNAASPTWTFTPQASTTATCRLVQGLSASAWSDCTGGSYSVPGIADGTYTVEVVVSDVAGNAADTATSAPYTSDRTAPAAPSVSGPSGPGKATSVTWTWTGEAGVTASCRLDRNGVVGSPVACSGGSYAPALTGDASYVVTVVLTDPAGNASPATTTAAYDLDTVVPATPTVTGSSGTGSTTSATWSWTPEAGATSSCVLVHDGVAGPPATCTSPVTVGLPADGAYQLRVTVTDPAGNGSGQATSPTYVLDTLAPVAPSVTTPASPSSSRTPSFAFTAESGATAECRWLQGTTVVADWAACTSPHSPSLTSLPDADYALEVRATDAAGNTGPAGSSLAYRLDTTAPAAPAVTMPAGPSSSTTPTISWTGEAGTTGSCVLALGGVAQPAASCATPYQPTLSGDGSWDVTVTLTDAAGNTSPAGTAGPYVLDTTPPNPPVLTAPASPSSDHRPIWGATVDGGDTTECQITSGATTVAGWAACSFPWTSDLTGLADGTYTVSVRAVDGVGLLSTAVSGSYVLDSTGPAAPVVTAPVTPGTSTAPVFSFTAEAGSTVACTVSSGARVVSGPATCSSPVTVDLSGEVDGPYTLTVTATDVAGNPGTAATATYVLDRVPPAAPVITASPASPAPSKTPSWSFTAEAGSTTSCTVTGASVGPVSSGACSSPFTAALPSDDTYTLTITATDAAGNTGAGVSQTYVVDTTAPAAPVLTSPASPSQNATPSWGVSTAEGRVECTLTQGATTVVAWTTCTSGFSPTLTADGTYTLTARTVDTAGNTSSTATSTYTLDRVAPAAPDLSTPSSPSAVRTPTWTVTGSEPGLGATCAVSGPGGPVGPAASCTAATSGSPYTADLSSAVDGGYTLTVTVTDAAGNASTATSTAYVLDTTVPSSVLITAPQSPGFSRVVTWALTGDTDSVLECSFTRPGAPASPFTACPGSGGGTGSYTADLTTESDGTYTLSARSYDGAGNVGPVTSSSYLLDTVAPPAPVGLRATRVSPSNVPAVSWTFTLEDGATGLCQLLSATAVVTAEAACTSPAVTDLSALPDGVYSLALRAKDAAGNTGPLVSADYTLDRTAPGGPVVTKTPGSPSPVTTPVWNVERSEASTQLQCRLVGLAGSDWSTCVDPVTFDLSPATSGSYTLELREVDAAGNQSEVVAAPVYVLDSNAPVPPEVSPPAKSPDNSTAPVFTISHGAGANGEQLALTCTVTRFDGKPGTASPCAFGANTVSLAGVAPRTQGLVSLAVQGKDAAGNLSGTATASYLYDSVPPPAAMIRPLASDVGTSPKVTWSFGMPDGAALRTADGPRTAALTTGGIGFACQLTRAGTGSTPAKAKTCTSPHTELLTQTGTWSLWVYAVDSAGNRSTPVSSRYTFVSPVPAVTDLRTPSSSAGSRPTWTFTVPPGYSAVCILSNSADAVLAQATCSLGRYTGSLAGQPHGGYTLTVQLLDTHGNEGPYTRSTPYSYKAASAGGPTVVRDGPGTGPAQPAAGSGSTPPTTFPRRNPPTSVPATPSTPSKTSTKAFSIPQPGGIITSEVPKAIGNTLKQVAQKPTIPLVLLGVVIGFLLLQNQIDRRDPKLASAPVGAEPELDFGPVQGLAPSADRALRRPRPHTGPLGGGAPA